jgi:SAM-dependent methyltransferase
MRLNLGCGPRHLPGFTNIDFDSNWANTPPDLACDLTKPLPFDDGVADEIHAYHLFEHFYRYETEAILADWVRVLKPGGMLVLEMPCLDKVVSIIDHCATIGEPIPHRLTLWALYGDPRYKDPTMCHRWCYSEQELGDMMAAAGLKWRSEEPQTHIAARDMRLVGVK